MGRGSNCFQGAAEEAQIDGLASHQREAMRQALMWQRQSASPRLHPSAPPAALKETSLAKGGPAGWMHNGRPNAKSPPVSKPENDGINIDTTRNHSWGWFAVGEAAVAVTCFHRWMLPHRHPRTVLQEEPGPGKQGSKQATPGEAATEKKGWLAALRGHARRREGGGNYQLWLATKASCPTFSELTMPLEGRG